MVSDIGYQSLHSVKDGKKRWIERHRWIKEGIRHGGLNWISHGAKGRPKTQGVEEESPCVFRRHSGKESITGHCVMETHGYEMIYGGQVFDSRKNLKAFLMYGAGTLCLMSCCIFCRLM